MKKIVWDKFYDPFEQEIEIDDDEEELDGDLKELPKKMLVTPQGIIPLTDELLISRKYNLWMAHTNFHLTAKLIDMIETIPGVESLDVFSPYRMRIGIGRLFDEKDVKMLIEYALGILSTSVESLDSETYDNVENMKETFKDNKHWVIYVVPNGKIISFVSDKDAVKEKITFFERVQEVAGGQLITNP